MTVKVADLTVDELRDLLQSMLRDLVDEVVEEKLGTFVDPDEGLTLKSDVADSLDAYLFSDRRGTDAADVFRSLGLDDE